MDYEGIIANLLDFVALSVLFLHFNLAMVVIMNLENRGFVPGTAPDAIMCTHNFPEFVECLENVDADTAVEACGLEQP